MGKDGQLVQSVPSKVMSATQTELSAIAGQEMLMMDAAVNGVDDIPEDLNKLPGGDKSKQALMYRMGAYVVDLSKVTEHITPDVFK